MEALLLLTLTLPLVVAALLATPLRGLARALVPLAALPALALAPPLAVDLPWLLIGSRLGVDTVNAPFLMLSALLWTAAGVYAHRYLAADRNRTRFHVFYLLTLTGCLGTVVALDAMSFYLFYTLMTFAAYGLVVHDGTAEARRAGRVYLILGLGGEIMLLVAILLLGAQFGNVDLRELPALLAQSHFQMPIILLTLAGFAIKVGVVPLHVWLPLAHPAAPIPASAVLSGILIKLGVLGWLRFLPLGEQALPRLGELFLYLGATATFYGVLLGLTQRRAKTVLAYSSISQMGLVTVLLGIALGNPERWSMVLMTLLLFCLHHGLAKGALFLGLGAVHRGWALLLLIVPALALAGAPLTSGTAAKLAFKSSVLIAPTHWWDELFQILTWSSLATSLLLARFLYLAWPPKATASPAPALWLPCVGLLLAGPVLSYWWLTTRIADGAALFEVDALNGALAPLLIAALIATGLIGLRRRLPRLPPWAVPEGDILALFSALAGGIQRLITRLGSRTPGFWHRHGQPWRSTLASLAALTAAWSRFNTALVFLLLLVGLSALLMVCPA